MELTVHDSILDVPDAEWDRLVPAGHLTGRHAFLRAVESSGINQCRFFYPVLRDRSGALAQAPVCVIATELDAFAHGAVRRVADALRRVFPGFLLLHSVEGGCPVALETPLWVRPGAAPGEVVPPLIQAVERRAQELGTGLVLFRDFKAADRALLEVVTACGYATVPNLPATELEIRWPTFTAYLEAQRSRYRQAIRTQERRCAEAGIRSELHPGFSTLADDLAGLWRQAYDRAQEYRRELLTPAFFRAVDQELGPRSAVLLLRRHERPVAFALLLLDDEVITPLFCGLDYRVSRECGLYFNLLYGAVRLAIEQRRQRVDFGITTLFPKLHLGCRIVPLTMAMKHRQPWLHRLIPRLFRAFTPPSRLTEPVVFKS